MRVWGFGAAVLTLSLLVSFPGLPRAHAAPLATLAPLPPPPAPLHLVPVVVFGQDARRAPQAFAREHDLDPVEVTRDHAASGLIICGNAHGAGQLTLTDEVVTTAAHVFFDENGLPRAASCSFQAVVNGRDVAVPVDLGSIVAGSTNPYAVAPAEDWAVARLRRPIAGIKPYGIATDIHEQEPITFVARGHIDWGQAKNLSMQDCTLHDQLSASRLGPREFSFDCDTGDGASGGALMFDRDHSRIGAILVGWRSNRPFSAMPYSRTHYNFAVTMEGAFRDAVYAAAGKLMVQK